MPTTTMGKKRKLSSAIAATVGRDDSGKHHADGASRNQSASNEQSSHSDSKSTSAKEVILEDNSTSVAGRPLPPLPSDYGVSHPDTMGSILLFYQYKEPMWTESEFQKVLKKFLAIGHRHRITGRGRIAMEGVNCTLTGTSPDIRAFCQALRDELDPELFGNTDFKITDNVPKAQLFKSLSMRKTDELVAYGLEKDKAPSIKEFGGTHLNAVDYHKALQDPNTVVIDVRIELNDVASVMMITVLTLCSPCINSIRSVINMRQP